MDAVIAMLPAPLQAWSTHMDFQGQRAAERTYQVILTISGIIGFIIGYMGQQLSYSIYSVLIGSAIAAFTVLPPWPFVFRRNPISWQPVNGASEKKSDENESKKKK